MSSLPRVRADLAKVELDGEAVLYDERSQTLHHLNATATLLFSLLDGTASIEQLADEIAECAGLQHEAVLREVRQTVDTFAEVGLLEVSDV